MHGKIACGVGSVLKEELKEAAENVNKIFSERVRPIKVF